MDVNVHQSASARTLLAEVLRSRSSRLSAKSIGRLPQGLRMLSLLIRNVMWAAWWPYSAWLLSLEKAAADVGGSKPSPKRRGDETGSLSQKSRMASAHS